MTLTGKEKLIMFMTMLIMVSHFDDLPSKKVGNHLQKYIENNHPKISPTKAEKILNDINSQLGEFVKILDKIYKGDKK